MIASLQIQDVVPINPYEFGAQLILFASLGVGVAWAFSNLLARTILNTVFSYVVLGCVLVSIIAGLFFFNFLLDRFILFVSTYPFGTLVAIAANYVSLRFFWGDFPIIERLSRLHDLEHHRHHERHHYHGEHHHYHGGHHGHNG